MIVDWSRLDRLYNQDLSSPAESPKYVDANLGPTHTNALDRAASDGRNVAPMLRAVRPIRGTGQTSSPAKSDEHSPGRDPVRADTRRVVLGSAGHIERLQTSRRRRKNSRKWLEGARVWR